MSPTDLSPSASSGSPIIEIRQVVKTFRNSAGEFPVLKSINLDLNRGEFVAIVGKSGSGKSTLLNMITGIDHPTSGKVLVDGVDIYAMSESARARWRGRNVGIVFQFFQLLPMLTLLENVMLPMDYADHGDFPDRPARALELLRQVGLEEQAHKLPAAVSTGQQQAAAIARALANDPAVIVADEATGNLDSRSAEMIVRLFESLAQAGKTIALVTHDPALAAHTTRTVMISDGELVDESLARALPTWPHRSLLDATRSLARFRFEPGAPILAEGQAVDYLYVIGSGRVSVLRGARDRRAQPLAELGPGEFFGEVELVKGGKALASIQAADDSPVELVGLPRTEVTRMMRDLPQAAEALGSIAEERLRHRGGAARAA
jgi:ABC-type lipoprotein export system ATPase subunit